MLILNPGLFKNAKGSRGLNTIELIILSAILLILTGTYAYFYKNPKINLNNTAIPLWAIALMLAITGASLLLLHNIFIAVLIGASLTCFIYDINKHRTLKHTIASFNACFINLVLVLGFAFNGINKIYSLITNNPTHALKFSLTNMNIGTGIILLLLGLSGIYASRIVTAKSIVNFIEKFKFKDIYSLATIPALAVAIQSAYMTFTPVKELIFSWTGNTGIALATAIIILSSTFLAVFALLVHKKQDEGIKQTKKPVNVFWVIISSLTAILTGIATLPLGKQVSNLKIVFWAIIAIFVTGLWFRRFNDNLFAPSNSKNFANQTLISKNNEGSNYTPDGANPQYA